MSRLVFRPAEVLPEHRSGGRELTGTSTKGSGRSRAGQPNVFARLQAFFPSNTPSSPRSSAVDVPVLADPKQTRGTSTRSPPRFLKVHVVSWNMHDSLPKGNLEDLLGTVPPYVPCPEGETDGSRIPNMAAEGCHPYHLVVVAGQECPTVSGIPKGLGASFRHKEKDRHKDGEKGSKKGRGKDGKDKDDLFELEGSPSNNPPITPTADAHSMASSHGPTSGWSWILEEWYCHGLGRRNDIAGTSSASELYNSQANGADTFDGAEGRPHPQHDADARHENDVSCTTGKEKQKKDCEKKRKGCCCKDKTQVGPYELLVKERLMGIYVAVFIYRDLKPLVRGVSKSAVSTGLIGGRVGNKGAVGISVNIDGTTLLFINAHLAAHEERVMSRVANIAKIKSELQVNDFLSQDDPRVMSEDMTDKFDYTFLFGDLNFRLDVTRLHADWLISRQDYDQALSFDQLRTLMKNGEAFVGFNEAPINFPPTFKYDVMKSLKRDRTILPRELGRARGGKRWLGQRSNPNLSEVQETEAEFSARLADENEWGVSMDAEDNGSFVSTAVTAMSMQSRMTANGDSDDNDGFFARSRSPRYSNHSKDEDAVATITTAHKLFLAKAALKAKTKWLSMLKSNVPRPSVPRRASKKLQRSNFSASSPQIKSRATRSDSTPPAFRAASSAIELGRLNAPSIVELRRTPSRKSTKSVKSAKILGSSKGPENTPQETEGGVYDTSSKQRVPSWCDRILWKSTVQPEPEEEEEEETMSPDHRNSGLGPRMRAFLYQALRPLSTRTRSASLSSIPSLSAVDMPSPLPAKDLSRPTTSTSDSQPLMTRTRGGSEKEPAILNVKSLANVVGMRYRPHRKARNPKLLKSRSIEPTSTTPLMSSSMRRRHSRAYTAMPVISAPVVTFPADSTLVAESETTDPPSLSPKDPVVRQRTTSTRGWLRFPFFNREAAVGSLVSDVSLDLAQLREPTSLTPHRPRRGEIVALGYNSLDDQAMRRLEGRSDHRPVIGSYAIYV